MGIQIEYLIPPIIVGLLILLIFRVNAFILESTVDNLVHGEIQTSSTLALEVLGEELRGLDRVIAQPDSILRFVAFNGDSVLVRRSGRNMDIIRRRIATGQSDTTSYALNLTDLLFSSQPDTVVYTFANFLRVNVETTSLEQQHARFRGDDNRVVRSRAQKEIFLRHRAALNQ